MDYFVKWLILALAFGILTSLVAQRKNRHLLGWFLIGFFFHIFGFIAALVIKPINPYPTKKCPACAEKINLEARVCRFCGHQFSDEDITRQLKAGLEIHRSSR